MLAQWLHLSDPSIFQTATTLPDGAIASFNFFLFITFVDCKKNSDNSLIYPLFLKDACNVFGEKH